MVSHYYSRLMSDLFKDRFLKLLDELKDKKIIIYGTNDEYKYLNKIYNLDSLNIVAATNKNLLFNKPVSNKIAIPLKDVPSVDFDYILITRDNYKPIKKHLIKELNIEKEKIKSAIIEDVKDEGRTIVYAEERNFSKRLDVLSEKLKGKKVLLYGAGAFLHVLTQHYDLSKLNIIGVADLRFTVHDDDETFCGYKVYSPKEIEEVNPDYVVLSTIVYTRILLHIYPKYLKKNKINVIPLIKRSLFEMLKEIQVI